MADERSVDVDEGRDHPPTAESGPPIAAGTRLSPVQEAWRAYVRHERRCAVCRGRDSRCAESTRLWQAWQELDGEVRRRLRDA